jgi:Ca2+-binding RTX toxin-like protein
MPPARRTLLQIIASGLALAGAAVALAAGLPSGGRSPKIDLLADGSISIADSLEGEAILTAHALYPGASETGTVTITNKGTAPGALSLHATDLEDVLGRNGGALSDALDLEITDVTGGSTAPIFGGSLADMPPQDLLVLPAGDERTYRFSITMEDNGVPATDYSGDNRLQSASSTFAYEWTLTETGVDPGPCVNAIRGDNGRNRLVGTALGDRMTGMGGSDRIRALAGDDCINGGEGGDVMRDGSGDDMVRGGSGADRIVGGPGEDAAYGGSGADRIIVRRGGIDFVDCGSGADRVVADRRDRLRNC